MIPSFFLIKLIFKRLMEEGSYGGVSEFGLD